jgi:hypothetical protein
MTGDPSTRHQFTVLVKDVKVHSAIEVIKEGKTPTSITFHLEPLGNMGTTCNLQLGLIGENLTRALRLQKSGSTIVEVGTDSWRRQCTTWREKVIDLALQQFATIPSRH